MIYRELLIRQDGRFDQSKAYDILEAYDIYENMGPEVLNTKNL